MQPEDKLKLLIIGEGPVRAELQQLTTSLNADDRILLIILALLRGPGDSVGRFNVAGEKFVG